MLLTSILPLYVYSALAVKGMVAVRRVVISSATTVDRSGRARWWSLVSWLVGCLVSFKTTTWMVMVVGSGWVQVDDD